MANAQVPRFQKFSLTLTLKIAEAIQPPIKAPTMPRMMVAIQPEGSGPDFMIALAMTPARAPRMIQEIIPMR